MQIVTKGLGVLCVHPRDTVCALHIAWNLGAPTWELSVGKEGGAWGPWAAPGTPDRDRDWAKLSERGLSHFHLLCQISRWMGPERQPPQPSSTAVRARGPGPASASGDEATEAGRSGPKATR